MPKNASESLCRSDSSSGRFTRTNIACLTSRAVCITLRRRVLQLLAPVVVSTFVLGCATEPRPKTVQFDAKQLGVAHYYPEGTLSLKPESRDLYIGTFSQGSHKSFTSGQDAFLAIALWAAITVCPAWRLAQRSGHTGALIRELPSRPGAKLGQFEIRLTKEPVVSGKISGDGQVEAINFLDADFQNMRTTLCDRTSELNHQW